MLRAAAAARRSTATATAASPPWRWWWVLAQQRSSASASSASQTAAATAAAASSTRRRVQRVQGSTVDDTFDTTFNGIAVANFVNQARDGGHLVAHLDPLERCLGPWLSKESGEQHRNCNQDLHWVQRYPTDSSRSSRTRWLVHQLGLRGPITSDTKFYVGQVTGGPPKGQAWWTLCGLTEVLRDAYFCTLTAEFDHVSCEHRQWIAEKMETPAPLPESVLIDIVKALIHADQFERFLGQRYPRAKRFSIEGCETMIPGLQAIIERSAEHGVDTMEVGMAHRGRLNVLANVIGKPLGKMFAEMSDQSGFHVGDVQYHLGNMGSIKTRIGQTVQVNLAPNPSHLEAVCPVVMGMVKGQQETLGSERVLGVLIHGDASFAGLGIVSETLHLGRTDPYNVRGMIQVVVNNQIGFTTAPCEGRVGAHPTSVARAYGIPVFHANADDPIAVHRACTLAADFRAQFGEDCVVDIVGYRRHGHNELDDPFITQPKTHQRIQSHPSVLTKFAQRLLALGVVSQQDLEKWENKVHENLVQKYYQAESGAYDDEVINILQSNWQGNALRAISLPKKPAERLEEPTGLPQLTVQWVGQQLHQVPDDITPHPKVVEILNKRAKMVEKADSRVDMATAESLAFGALSLHRNFAVPHNNPNEADRHIISRGLNLGHFSIRMSGQDCERGTFNTRHGKIVDQETGKLHNMFEFSHVKVDISNSPLAEFAPLAFEYGYSLATVDTSLTIWEAQFGDFANNAQVVFDQFVATGEERWGLESGLVVMLPHGYSGQGPDHSSGRLERFLALCNDDADFLPGSAPDQQRAMREAFKVLKRSQTLDRATMVNLFKELDFASHVRHAVDALWNQMELQPDAEISMRSWERYMAAYLRTHADEDCNLIVANVTTPANLFHILRQQTNRKKKKPLILMTQKWLLHHKPCTSPLSAFVTGTFFDPLIVDGELSDNMRHLTVDEHGEQFLLPRKKITRVILCSGQVFYHLYNTRKRRKRRDIVLARLEQISPFPHTSIAELVDQYPNAQFVWCQEEPKNMGAWSYVQPRVRTTLKELFPGENKELTYIGRPSSASPATASMSIHQQETTLFLNQAIPPLDVGRPTKA